MRTTQQKDDLTLTTSIWQHHHILDLDDFTRDEIKLVFHTTEAMKEVLSRPIKKVPTLRGKTIVTLFYEPYALLPRWLPAHRLLIGHHEPPPGKSPPPHLPDQGEGPEPQL